MSTKATQTPSQSVVTTSATPLPGVETPKAPSRFLDRMTKGTHDGSVTATAPPDAPAPAATPAPAKPSKLEAARNLGQRQLRTRLADPPAPALSTTTTPTANEPAPAISTTTTPAEPPPATPPGKGNGKPPKRAKGYEGAPGGHVERLVKSVEKLAKTVVDQRNQPPAKQPDDVTLTSKQKRHLQVMAQMEEMYPDEYKGLAAKAKALIPKLAQFEADYKAKNPESTAEDLEEARAEFEESNGVAFDPDDFEEATWQLRTKPLNDKISEQQQTIQRLQVGEHKRQVRTVVATHAANAANEIVGAFSDVPEIAEVLDDKGNLDPDAVQKLLDNAKDPITAEVAVETIRASQEFAEGVVLAFNGQETPLLHNVAQFCQRIEQALAAQDPEQTKNDEGKYFMPRAQYMKLKDDERQDYYILTPDLVVTLANEEIIKMAKSDIEAEKKRLAKYAPKLGYNAGTAPAAPPAPAATPKPASPSSTATIPTAPSGTSATPPAGGFMERMKKGVSSTLLHGKTLVR